ncbi:MAG TPA: hypothetical protein VFP65_25655, partial [Anaeromyxobacteraceae bacterium]|nr:hypothetical protein [Anaeromyxobacteraceae bacterium]
MALPCAVLVTLLAAAAEPAAEAPSSTLAVANRDIVTFRATVHGAAPAERVRAARQRLDGLSATELDEPVTHHPLTIGDAHGFAVTVGSRYLFAVTDGDRDPLAGESTADVASAAVRSL